MICIPGAAHDLQCHIIVVSTEDDVVSLHRANDSNAGAVKI